MGDRLVGWVFASRSEVRAKNAMAATSQPLATEAALRILGQGGSAVDAAIAANATLTVVEPTGCGLGGDLFALVWDPDLGRLVALNGAGRSPRRLRLEHLRSLGERIPERGPLSVSTPGCVDAWFLLHERYGRLPMSRVLAPAIQHAREGFPVSATIAASWERGARVLGDAVGFRATFLPHGRAPAKGDVFRNESLARTLERLADEGRDAFYAGAAAAAIEAACRRVGGLLDVEDLASHRGEWVEPIRVGFRGAEVHVPPPNGAGLAALQMLNLLEPFDLEGMGFGSGDHLHHVVEAKKISYEDRARHYADPARVEVPVDHLLSRRYADERRGLLGAARALTEVSAGDPRLAQGDTVSLAVADSRRLFVSLMQSNYMGFGSGVSIPELGFGLQNRGCLFALEDGHPNVYEPGKRPFHTLVPAFLTRDGRPLAALGVMGGDMQPQGLVQVLLNHLVYGMDLQEAGDAPRACHSGSSSPTGARMQGGGTLALESGFTAGTREDLRSRGHRLSTQWGGFGGYQAVGYDPERDVLAGASESRLDGQAAGF